MNFETMDWEAEAEKIRLAFGIQEPSVFFPKFGNLATMEFVPAANPLSFIRIQNALFSASYRSQVITFTIQSVERKGKRIAQILWLDGEPIQSVSDSEYSTWLARGFYLMDRLTPEVEAALNVTISAHQKLEWMLRKNEKARLI